MSFCHHGNFTIENKHINRSLTANSYGGADCNERINYGFNCCGGEVQFPGDPYYQDARIPSQQQAPFTDIGKNGDSIYEKVGNSLYYTCGSVSTESAECS